MNIMDLSNLAVSQDAFKLEILHPVTGEVIKDKEDEFDEKGKLVSTGKPFTVSILSSDTNQSKKVMSDTLRDARKKTKGGKEDLTERESYLIQCRALAKVTTGCYLVLAGEVVKHSEDAIFDLISKPEYTWLKNQIQNGLDNRENFIKS